MAPGKSREPLALCRVPQLEVPLVALADVDARSVHDHARIVRRLRPGPGQPGEPLAALGIEEAITAAVNDEARAGERDVGDLDAQVEGCEGAKLHFRRVSQLTESSVNSASGASKP